MTEAEKHVVVQDTARVLAAANAWFDAVGPKVRLGPELRKLHEAIALFRANNEKRRQQNKPQPIRGIAVEAMKRSEAAK